MNLNLTNSKQPDKEYILGDPFFLSRPDLVSYLEETGAFNFDYRIKNPL